MNNDQTSRRRVRKEAAPATTPATKLSGRATSVAVVRISVLEVLGILGKSPTDRQLLEQITTDLEVSYGDHLPKTAGPRESSLQARLGQLRRHRKPAEARECNQSVHPQLSLLLGHLSMRKTGPTPLSRDRRGSSEVHRCAKSSQELQSLFETLTRVTTGVDERLRNGQLKLQLVAKRQRVVDIVEGKTEMAIWEIAKHGGCQETDADHRTQVPVAVSLSHLRQVHVGRVIN
jgi:hypothetical protein